LSEIGEEVVVILSTHLVEDVRNLCSKMAIMDKGKVLAQGSPNDFIQNLEGKIWKKQIDKTDLETYKTRFNVISSQFVAGKMNINVLSEEKIAGFETAIPTLEDVYFSILNQNNI
jgi:ABC-type multidrug transport system ATPase subunit